MNCCFKTFTAFFLFLVSSSTTMAQNDRPFVVGIGAGTYVYQGDLVPSYMGGYKALHPALQVYAGKWINPYFQVRASIGTGKIEANDADYSKPAWKKDRNLRFSSPITQITGRILFSPFGNSSRTPDRRLYPYLFGGAGVSKVRVKRDWSGISAATIASEKMATALAADSAALLPTSIVSIPLGAGANYALSPRWSLFGEAAYHLSMTDYLDGFSYVGNSNRKDNYYMMNIRRQLYVYQRLQHQMPAGNVVAMLYRGNTP